MLKMSQTTKHDGNSGCTKCLICDKYTQFNYLLNASHKKRKRMRRVTRTDPVLLRNLHVIFLLKNVLELPSNKLVLFLHSCPNIEDWVSCCQQCGDLVSQCKQIYQELLNVSRKFNAAKRAVIKITKESKTNSQTVESFCGQLDISEETRTHVCAYEYDENSTDPFILGDLKAHEEVSKLGNQLKTTPTENLVKEKVRIKDNVGEETTGLWTNGELKQTLFNLGDNDCSNEERSPPGSAQALPAVGGAFKGGESEDTPTVDSLFLEEDDVNDASEDEDSNNDRKELHCSICHKVYFYQASLKSHMIKVHMVKVHGALKNNGTDDKVTCAICSQVFKNQTTLGKHVRFVHEQRFDFQCDHCGSGMRCKQLLEKHKKKCSGESWTCPLIECGRTFHKKESVSMHVLVAHKDPNSKINENVERPHMCETCGLAFRKRSNLKGHIDGSLSCKLLRMSESEATVICDVCGMHFANRINLKRHVRQVHENKWRIYCEHCGKGLTNNYKLKIHLFRSHQIGENVVGSKKNFLKCPVEGCCRTYRKSMMKYHMAQHNQAEPKFKCDTCGKSFYFRKYLWQHMYVVHRKRVKKTGNEKEKSQQQNIDQN